MVSKYYYTCTVSKSDYNGTCGSMASRPPAIAAIMQPAHAESSKNMYTSGHRINSYSKNCGCQFD